MAAGILFGCMGMVVLPASAQDFDGEWRYRTSCAGCHGTDGEGNYGFAPALKGNPFVQNVPAPNVIQVIQEGRMYSNRNFPAYPGMPAFHYLRGGEAQALVDYLKGDLQN